MSRSPKKIIIQNNQHQPSMHIVGARPKPPVIEKPKNQSEDKEYFKKIKYLLENTSIGTVLSFFGLLLARLAIFIFRLPKPPSQEVKQVTENRKPKTVKISHATRKFPTLSFRWAGASFLIFVLLLSFYSVDQSLAQIQTRTVNNVEQGMRQLIEGNEALTSNDLAYAYAKFAAAEQSFQNAHAEVNYLPESLDKILAEIPLLNGLSVAESSLALAMEISQMGQDIVDIRAESSDSTEYLIKILATQEEQQIYDKALSVIDLLQQINPNYAPDKYQAALREAQVNYLPTAKRALIETRDINQVLTTLSGTENKKRFFIAFQNSNELRASGGFLGSFAILDISNGAVKSLEVPSGGTYDVQGQQTATLVPPPALSLVSKRWELQDANWWINWPTSAQHVSSLYESAGGSSVDGVIGINTSVLEQLLDLTGPVTLNEYNLTLTSENVVLETQYHIEYGYDKTQEKPKEILSKLVPIVIERLQEKIANEPLVVGQVLLSALQEKNIQIYARDKNTADSLRRLGWDGAIDSVGESDSLAIVHSNIAGQKTDGVIKNSANYEVFVDENGKALAKLVVTREHTGKKGDLFTGVRNVDFVRVYVPAGSRLISAKGFTQPDGVFFDAPQAGVSVPEIIKPELNASVDSESQTMTYKEFDRTVFANWMMTDPGQTSTATLVYQLPDIFIKKEKTTGWLDFFTDQIDTDSRYEFQWIQQPGLGEVRLTHKLRSAKPLASLTSSSLVKAESDGWIWNGTVDTDKILIVDIEAYGKQ